MQRSDIVKDVVSSIASYVPGRSIEEIADAYGFDPASVIKLGSNENPLGPSPKAVEALIKHAIGLSVYLAAE